MSGKRSLVIGYLFKLYDRKYTCHLNCGYTFGFSKNILRRVSAYHDKYIFVREGFNKKKIKSYGIFHPDQNGLIHPEKWRL